MTFFFSYLVWLSIFIPEVGLLDHPRSLLITTLDLHSWSKRRDSWTNPLPSYSPTVTSILYPRGGILGPSTFPPHTLDLHSWSKRRDSWTNPLPSYSPTVTSILYPRGGILGPSTSPPPHHPWLPFFIQVVGFLDQPSSLLLTNHDFHSLSKWWDSWTNPLPSYSPSVTSILYHLGGILRPTLSLLQPWLPFMCTVNKDPTSWRTIFIFICTVKKDSTSPEPYFLYVYSK